jgi:hypothetical protein
MIKRMIKGCRQNRMPRQASDSPGLMDDQGASDRKSDAQLMVCSLLAFRTVRPLGGGGERAEDAELVAFWVGEHHPGDLALTYVGTAGTEPEQPLHLRLV